MWEAAGVVGAASLNAESECPMTGALCASEGWETTFFYKS